MAAEGPLRYYGGKKIVAMEIIQHFPKSCGMYVEPFFGGGGIFFQLPPELYPVQIVNDLNRSIVTFYRVLRTRTDDLVRVCKLTPYSLDEQRTCRNSAEDPKDDELETARRVWVRHRQNFAGTQHSGTGWSRPMPGVSMAKNTESALKQLHDYADRLRMVHFDCEDAVDVIRRTGNENVFIYEDPPYHPEQRQTDYGYQLEMSEEHHVRLLEVNMAASEKGALIMMSGYAGPFYDKAYESWRRIEFNRANTANTEGGERIMKVEVLWMNYPEELEIGQRWSIPPPKTVNSREKALLSHMKKHGRTR